MPWKHSIRTDTGILDFTAKRLYFSGPKKKFRIRHDRIVEHEPFGDGFGIMQNAQTAKPQQLRTGNGRFVYNMATNLAWALRIFES